MKSVTNVRKITSAMKMVAASKLRGVQTRMEISRPLAERTNSALQSVPQGEGQGAPKNPLIVTISSDRGLCGGVNSNAAKAAKEVHGSVYGGNANILLIGDKARGFLNRSHSQYFTSSMTGFGIKPFNFTQASIIAEEVASVEHDQATIIYNKFKSVVAYDTITDLTVDGPSRLMENSGEWSQAYEIEGDEASTMQDLYEFNLANTLYCAIYENQTVEQGQRMSAMDNASKNAGEMIDKLTLLYNKARQANITTELVDIVSGAESVAEAK